VENNIKILLLDIENSPNLGYVWGLWQQNIALNQLVNVAETLCWSAKWLGNEDIYFDSLQQSSKKRMLKGIHKLLDEADAVIHYNGSRHDIPHLNRGFVEIGLAPPSPYKQIDLLTTAKRQFKFPSNKLEYVAKALGVGEKMKNSGFELWTRCMANDPDAWAEMEAYNIQDVLVLEKVYYKLLPWIKQHANYSLHSANALVCPHCGSTHVQKRGFSKTLASVFQRYQCSDCGTWFKDNVILNRKDYKTSEVN
jgi:DNA polymerase elongation subunit (family B)